LIISGIREEHRVLKEIFGPKRDEVTEEWRKVHVEKLHKQYIIRMIKTKRME
jgi:hypothetical protein